MTADDIAADTGAHPRTVYYRLQRGVRGDALLAPPAAHRQAGGLVKPGSTWGREQIDLPDLAAWEQVLRACALATLPRAALLYNIPPRALRAVVFGEYHRVDCVRELLAAMNDEDRHAATARLRALSRDVPTTGRI